MLRVRISKYVCLMSSIWSIAPQFRVRGGKSFGRCERESIKVMTVRIRVPWLGGRKLYALCRVQGGRLHPGNFHGNEKRRAALINVLGTAFWAYIDEFAIVIHWCNHAVSANEMKCDRLSLVKRSGEIKSRIAVAVTSDTDKWWRIGSNHTTGQTTAIICSPAFL